LIRFQLWRTRTILCHPSKCLRMLLGIKWYHFISSDEVRRQTNQPLLMEIIQEQRLTLFGHIARMDDNRR